MFAWWLMCIAAPAFWGVMVEVFKPIDWEELRRKDRGFIEEVVHVPLLLMFLFSPWLLRHFSRGRFSRIPPFVGTQLVGLTDWVILPSFHAMASFIKGIVTAHAPIWFQQFFVVCAAFRWRDLLGEGWFEPLWPFLKWFCLVSLGLIFPFCLLVLFFVGGIEFLYYATAVALVGGTWSVIYSELYKAFCRRFCRMSFARFEVSLRTYARAEIETSALYIPLQRQLDTACQDFDPPTVSLLPALQDAWLDLASADDAFLLLFLRHYTNLAATVATWGTLEQTMLQSACESLSGVLRDELARRQPSSDNPSRSYRHIVYELAGIVVRYVIPLPCLRHLARPFRFTPFLPFLMTYPGFYFSPSDHIVDGYFSPARLSDSPGGEFSTALYQVLSAAQAAAEPPAKTAELLSLALRTADAHEKALPAEDKAHDLILDAVLWWKERQRELRRREEEDEGFELYGDV